MNILSILTALQLLTVNPLIPMTAITGSPDREDITDRDGTDRLLSVQTPEGTGSVRLQVHGAFAGAFADMDAVAPAKGKTLRGKPRMALKGANLVRCMHMKDAPEFRFKVRGDLRDLRLLVRTEVDSIAVLLDGVPVVLTADPVALPEGFRQLYRASEPFALRRGTHTVSFPEGDVDMRYLPSAYIAGDVPALDEDQPYVDWLRIKPGMHGDKASTGVYLIEKYSEN